MGASIYSLEIAASEHVKLHMAVEAVIKQKALMAELVEQFEALPEAWFQNELFEQTRDYLARGRRFERMRDDQLNEEWAKAFRQFVRLHVGPHVRDMADSGAELRLRGAEFPTHLVTSEVDQLEAVIGCVGPVPPAAEFDRTCDEFFGDLGKQPN